MPNIPTPFVGGADRPNVDRSRGQELAPPFLPDAEGEAPDVEVEPATEGDEPVMELEVEDLALEAETRPEAEDVAEGPTAEAIVEEVPVTDEEEVPAKVEDESVSVPEYEPEAEVESPVSAEVEPMVGGDDFGIPDFLFGPDGDEGADEEPTESIEALEADSEAPETPDPIDEKARELLAGDAGERIRTLMSDLGLDGAEEAIARAYAAGYLERLRDEE